MAKPGQSSFRRTLLSRILLLSIPVLLVGETVTYRKTRSGLLETARYNLTESAIRKGDSIQDSIKALRANLVTAAETSVIQSGAPEEIQPFIDQLAQTLPTRIRCVQLIDLKTKKVEASTCGNQPITNVSPTLWDQQQNALLSERTSVHILPTNTDKQENQPASQGQLNLILSAPVYIRDRSSSSITTISSEPGTISSTVSSQDSNLLKLVEKPEGQLRYALTVQATVHQKEVEKPGSLTGYTVVIDQSGTLLAHPVAAKVGRNIRQEADFERLQDITSNAIAGRRDTLHLFSFKEDGREWLAGYSSVIIPVSPKTNYTWVVMAVTPMNSALYNLGEIKQVLIILTLGLIFANLLATIYLARDTALPLEQLSAYALRIHQRLSPERAPKNFKIRELNQLAEALDSMVERLEERAEELEAAWQEAQAANQLKSEFLATTSHELRTPLNAIIGCIQLVRDGCCDDREEEMDFLLQAHDSAMHLLKIINDLLDISKIEAGKVELNLQPVSIRELCEQCLKMIQPGAEKKQLSLSLDLDPRVDWVPLDERRVRQMLINLLSNAVKFTPEGGRVKLSSKLAFGEQLAQEVRPDHSPINASTPYLCLEVDDTGIGIPEDRWHLLFRPFQQADSSLTRKHEGTGLGLALTKRLAELHGGTISFQSISGKGSAFRIWLPCRKASNTQESLLSKAAESDRFDSPTSDSQPTPSVR
jgi:signal transduction histidine kinase